MLSHEMRVLVVDDEPDVLLLCRVNLEFEGHEVLEAPDGEEGLALALRELPDIIVLDVMLPHRDGFSILRELRERSVTAAIPVILLTAKVQEEDQLRGWQTGAADYVTKPFSPAALTQAVERVARLTPSEREERRRAQLQHLSPLYEL